MAILESLVSKSIPPTTLLATNATRWLRNLIWELVTFSATTVNLALGNDVVVPVPIPT